MLLLVGMMLSSCGAHSPRVLDEKYQTVHIPVIKNKSFQYGLEERLTHTMIERFIRDGRLRVSPKSVADLEIACRIDQAEISPLAYSDLDRAVGFNMLVVMSMDVVDIKTSEKIIENKTFTTKGTYILSTEPSREQIHDVSRKLSNAVLSYLVEGW